MTSSKRTVIVTGRLALPGPRLPTSRATICGEGREGIVVRGVLECYQQGGIVACLRKRNKRECSIYLYSIDVIRAYILSISRKELEIQECQHKQGVLQIANFA